MIGDVAENLIDRAGLVDTLQRGVLSETLVVGPASAHSSKEPAAMWSSSPRGLAQLGLGAATLKVVVSSRSLCSEPDTCGWGLHVARREGTRDAKPRLW